MRKDEGATRKVVAFASQAEARNSPAGVASVESFRALLDGLNIGIANVKTSGEILYCNPRFRDVLGDSPLFDVPGDTLQHHIGADSWPAIHVALSQAEHCAVEAELRIESFGRTRFLNLTLSPVTVASATTIRIVAAEVTQLVETSKALDRSQAELQALSKRIMDLQEDERRRIARDIHDVTGQELAVVLMTLGATVSRLGGPRREIHQHLTECMNMLRNVDREVRTLTYLLHPPLLDEVGLSAALQSYVGGFQKRTGLEIRMEGEPCLPRLTRERETALFRVVQEGLTNVIRHSGATQAVIRTAVTDTAVQLFIEDNGRGMRESKPKVKKRSSGVGIPGMTQRLRQLGGQLEVSSRGRGTVLFAAAPLGTSESVKVGALTDTGTNSRAIRILIADDHDVTRRGVRSLLEEQKDFQVCGEVADGLEAISQAMLLQPDILILDLTMPQASGFSVVARLQDFRAATKTIVLTAHTFPGLERTLHIAGAHGLVLKQNAAQELVHAIRTVLGGSLYFWATSHTGDQTI